MLRGFRCQVRSSLLDIVPVIEAIVTGLSLPLSPMKEILAGPDDEGAFSRILLSRIGSQPLLEEVECEIVAEDSPLLAWIDRDHFMTCSRISSKTLSGQGLAGSRSEPGREKKGQSSP